MGVKQVDHQERGLPRETREPDEPVVVEGAGVELARLRARIEAARGVAVPKGDHENHCGHCFGRGRDAAIRIIMEGE